MRCCRAILGISQRELAEITGMALQSIKRLEKKGTHPRYTTIIKLRNTFIAMGLKCQFSEADEIQVVLEAKLITAINEGELFTVSG